ncbi:phenylalanine--tRNA ligase subunit beta [Rhabdochlamydiaceae symbiont of Dictyostelium giganteum]|uniref:phenylalanine--tRNA ligase subunit beta n=1 Tax=Rhabdochlamydiaceae symbiont of Dictyostelium giganteum TaxID=3342349 RepID=UPI00384CE5B6
MKVSLSWLKQFIPLTQTPDEIALHLTRLGIEVENIQGKAPSFSKVVTAKVLSAEKHPHADRLQIATVYDGSQNYQVVCGASNCRAGIIAPFAQVGASLTDKDNKTWSIKQSKIRQVESEGMLCSLDELGLEESSSGIFEFGENTPLGIPVETILLDPVFDLSLTPNLGHVQSVLGVARELSATFKIPLHTPSLQNPVTGQETLSIQIENREDTPRFSCRVIEGITVNPSPSWLQNRLKACGINPINNVIDAVHYTMLELGMPLHVYDRSSIQGDTLFIRRSEEKSAFITLDDVTRDVPKGALMVYDAEKPLILAGIMGGQNSSLQDTTQTIVVECAAFSPLPIRQVSRFLDLKTDASYRFDRGVDIGCVLKALERASSLIMEVAGGSLHPISEAYPLKAPLRKIKCRPWRINQILGFTLSLNEVISLFDRLELKVEDETQESLNIQIPSYRNDLVTEIDLIEEIARLYGYDNFPKVRPLYSAGALPNSPLAALEAKTRALFLQEGLQECITCDLISPEEEAVARHPSLELGSILKVLHPRSLDQSVLRTSLLPGLLKVAIHNFNHQNPDLALFEIGRVHFKEKESVQEPSCAAILLSGAAKPPHFMTPSSSFDFFDLKGLLENWLTALMLPSFTIRRSQLTALHPWRQAEIVIQEEVIGSFGEVHPDILSSCGIKHKLLFAEFNLEDIFHSKKIMTSYTPIIPYPSSTRDWTVKVKKSVDYHEITRYITEHTPPHLESFTLISAFQVPEDPHHQNITLRFIYRHPHETIAASTVDKEHDQLTHSVAKKLSDLL